MPLDPLQERIAQTALALPQSHTLALAGGGAMIVHGFVTRPTKDIDLFTEIDDHEARLVVAALRRTLRNRVSSPTTASGLHSTTASSPSTQQPVPSVRSRFSPTEAGCVTASSWT